METTSRGLITIRINDHSGAHLAIAKIRLPQKPQIRFFACNSWQDGICMIALHLPPAKALSSPISLSPESLASLGSRGTGLSWLYIVDPKSWQLGKSPDIVTICHLEGKLSLAENLWWSSINCCVDYETPLN